MTPTTFPFPFGPSALLMPWAIPMLAPMQTQLSIPERGFM